MERDSEGKKMSIFTKADYTQKNQKNVMVKTRLPTESKTRKHKCSKCPRKDAKKYNISDVEKIWLCPTCLNKYLAQFQDNHFVNFVIAGKLI